MMRNTTLCRAKKEPPCPLSAPSTFSSGASEIGLQRIGAGIARRQHVDFVRPNVTKTIFRNYKRVLERLQCFCRKFHRELQ